MRQLPTSRRSGIIEHPCGDDTLLLDAGRAHRLDALATAVWRAADGERDVDALLEAARAVRPEVDRTLLFEVLDRLADEGLLEARLGPPAGLSRRVLVQRLAGASAAAALGLVVGVPRTAEAASCGDADAVVAALKRLVSDEKLVASELEAVVVEALEADSPDPTAIGSLSAKEADAKATQVKHEEMRFLAELDAKECRAPGDRSARLKRRQQAAERRQEMHTKRRAANDEKSQKRMKGMAAKESQAKAKLAAREKQEKQGASSEAQTKSQARHQEQATKSKQRHQLRRKSQEKHHKRQASHVEKHHKTASEHLTKAKKKPLKPLLAQEEGAKVKQADEARAEAVKKAGSSVAHAKRIAKEARMKTKAKTHESATKRQR